jgi:hypothetical protein
MLKSRFDSLTEYDSESPEGILTAEEIEEGWHYCLCWDHMLIHPKDTDEYALCECAGQEKFAEQARNELDGIEPSK